MTLDELLSTIEQSAFVRYCAGEWTEMVNEYNRDCECAVADEMIQCYWRAYCRAYKHRVAVTRLAKMG